MTCPNCSCPKCRTVELNAVLSRRVARETNNSSELRDAFKLLPSASRFAEPRELGKPPVDPDAEQLAGQVGALADELARGAA